MPSYRSSIKINEKFREINDGAVPSTLQLCHKNKRLESTNGSC